MQITKKNYSIDISITLVNATAFIIYTTADPLNNVTRLFLL